MLRTSAHEHSIPMDDKEVTQLARSSGLLLLLMGVCLLMAGIWVARDLHTIWNTWSSVDGVVVRGSVEEFTLYPTARGAVPLRRYRPRVEFRYFVLGKPYTRQVASDSSYDTYNEALGHLLATYPPASHHAIRYNPKDPTEIGFGVVNAGTLLLAFVLLVLGAGFAARGVNTLVTATTKRRVLLAPSLEPGARAPAQVVELSPRPAAGLGSVATLRCPSCGEQVEANRDNCPKCSRSLRAA